MLTTVTPPSTDGRIAQYQRRLARAIDAGKVDATEHLLRVIQGTRARREIVRYIQRRDTRRNTSPTPRVSAAQGASTHTRTGLPLGPMDSRGAGPREWAPAPSPPAVGHVVADGVRSAGAPGTPPAAVAGSAQTAPNLEDNA